MTDTPSDLDQTAGLAAQLAANDTSGVEVLFAQAGARLPLVIWSPQTQIAERALIRQFSRICDTLSDDAGVIDRAHLSLDRFGTMTDWLMLMTARPDGHFGYEHYGRGIANIYGRDLTGSTTRDFPGHISAFFAAVYRAAQIRRERVMTIHQPPNQVFASYWHRLIVPIAGSGVAEVDGFLVLNTPENELRAGLEVLPVAVLIVDDGMVVRYANKRARQDFDKGAFGPWDRSVFDYSGLDLEIGETPERIMSQGMVHMEQCRSVMHQQIGVYEATISAARHHDRAFYVVMLQPR